MEPMRAGASAIDVCVACGTRWFDRSESEALVAQAKAGTVLGWEDTLDETDVSATCPRCRTDTLMPHRYGAAGFRRCDTCGGVSVPSQEFDVMLRSASGTGGKLADIVKELFAH
jgi:Zn-finger nucleic acid-binding protein